MGSSLLSAMVCISGIVIAAIVVLVITLLKPKPGKTKEAQSSLIKAEKPTHKSWQSWLLPIGIAFLIAIWTVFGALFFLAAVWVLRLNPGTDVSFTLDRNDQKTAQRVYTWLFFSPFITVPIFIGAVVNASYNATINERVLTALIPLIIHAPLLLGLTSKSGFVYRHTQQGILFIAVRAGMASLAAINVEDHIDYALLLFFFGNGALWLIGNIVGGSQVSNRKCWFMERKGEKIILPGLVASENIDHPIMDKELTSMLESLNADSIKAAKEKALHAFQTGTPTIKKRAVAVLTKLGEVEKS